MNGKQGDSRRMLDQLLVSGCAAGWLKSVARVAFLEERWEVKDLIGVIARSYMTM